MSDDWSLEGKEHFWGGSINDYQYNKKDIETLREKLIEDISDYENPFIAEQYFNPTNAYEKLEHLRSFVIEIINKRFGVKE